MIVADHHRRGRDLLHGRFWQVSFGSLQLVAIAATAAAARNRLSGLKDGNVLGRNQRYGLMGLGNLLDHIPAENGNTDNRADQNDMHKGGSKRTILFVIVKSPDVFYRHWL